MNNIFILLVLFLLAYIYTKKKKTDYTEVISKENNISEVDSMEKVEMIDLENSELGIREILKIKKAKSGSYRNYPNQNSLKQIYRRKPKYLVNSKYTFNENNHDEDKLKIEMSKYLIFEQQEEKYFNKRPLPEQYHNNEIVLIPKNTDTLFTYWEIREDFYYTLNNDNKLVNENPVIILKSVDGEEKVKIQTHSRNGSMYINNVDSNQEYIVYLGYLDEFNNFIEIAHSTEANVPNPLPSENFNVNWGVSEVINVDGKQVISFKNIDKNNVSSYLGYQQEVLDKELLSDEEIQSLVRKEDEARLLNGSSFQGSSFTGSSKI
ncbi:DUF4912 domain-containing protein [Streptobacillus moniliformis]|uniref:DUF4912 domain-containing protein n=1 Tax=Streptobacillus moniliformis TaxID=34105 RepID=UPI0007E402C8|nr:DUF4912 domain-containing protein [Streptobacillus moniliformis]